MSNGRWEWSNSRNDWVWVENRGANPILRLILVILVIFFLVYVLFPGDLIEYVKNGNLFPPIPTNRAPAIQMPQPEQLQGAPVQPSVIVVTATPRPGFDVPITPMANPAWVGPQPTTPSKPSILEWRPGQPLPDPMGPPPPPGYAYP